jgi:PPK2 family polyphosphate:nucleotide phosphotransferase
MKNTKLANLASAFRVVPGTEVKLDRLDPADHTALGDKDDAKRRAKADAKRIDELQDLLYAEGSRALLIVLQGTDTSGKDGTIRHVFAATSPLGITVSAFKRPTEEELAHDFLWRVHAVCPRRGTIGIFNRSHYEDVLAARVHKLAPPAAIEARYDAINRFETLLVENGTTILKFMLHISKDEQRKRLQDRLDNPAKHWKFQPNDLADRKLWPAFQTAYEIMLNRCSTEHAPWHVIPADHEWARNATITAIVRETLEAMNPKPAAPTWEPRDFKI